MASQTTINRIKFLALAIGICLPALLPLLRPQFFHTHDWTHVARLVEMDTAIRDGHFPVRWSKHLGYGYGLPQFNFYAPLVYYAAWMFYAIGWGAVGAIKLVIGLNYFGSFVAMYLLGRKLFNRTVGVIAGTAFIYIPYRAVDTYVRGALGELTAMTFLAVTLYFIVSWYKNEQTKIAIGVAVSWAMIWLAHNLTGMMTTPIILALLGVGVYLDRNNWQGKLKQVGLITGGAVGLAAFYVWPMIGEQGYTQAAALTGGFSDFHHHFLYLRQFFISSWGYGGSIFGTGDDLSFRIGNVQAALSLVTLVWLGVNFKKWSPIQRTVIMFSYIVILVAMLMSTFKTQFIWEAISLLRYIQFPWRFLTVIGTFISLTAGAAILVTSKLRDWKHTGLTVITILALMLSTLIYFRPESYLSDNNSLYYTDPVRIEKEMSGIIPDFISKNNTVVPPPPPAQRFVLAEDQGGRMQIEIDRTAEYLVTVAPGPESLLTVNILAFPGWRAYLDGKETTVTVAPEWPVQIIRIPASEKVTVVSGKLTNTPIRSLGNMLTILTLGVMIYLLAKEPNGRYLTDKK